MIIRLETIYKNSIILWTIHLFVFFENRMQCKAHLLPAKYQIFPTNSSMMTYLNQTQNHIQRQRHFHRQHLQIQIRFQPLFWQRTQTFIINTICTYTETQTQNIQTLHHQSYRCCHCHCHCHCHFSWLAFWLVQA